MADEVSWPRTHKHKNKIYIPHQFNSHIPCAFLLLFNSLLGIKILGHNTTRIKLIKTWFVSSFILAEEKQ